MFDKIPLFPLNTILFPGMPINIHIFEKRYQIMMDHILKSNPVFGAVLIRRGTESLGPLAEPHMYGTIARIVDVEPLKKGLINITAVGEKRFTIQEIFQDQPYLTAHVHEFPLEYRRPLDVYRRIRPLRNHIQYYLQTLNLIDDVNINLSELEMPEDPISLLFLAASLLQIPPHEKLPVITAATVMDVCISVERLYRRENAILKNLIHVSDEEARNFARLN
jgi:Lon protease-like protein